ncbi:hypothetical protein EW146_g3075 [Bondarzewia mesenterica]|uniref:DAGKc domain-containing protein n=1 Tax=Bondarzewia mesenterica TaxID=1095465 RepID=A0A4S4M0J2_9AGAM|nr:hypothetical protein EW146_g3075 [Bondarzewia mesenterica]
MAPQKLDLVLNGTHTTFSFTDSHFFVNRRGRGQLPTQYVPSRGKLTPIAVTVKSSLGVPLQRVLWAESTDSGTVVHVLAKKSRHGPLALVKVEGILSQGDEDELSKEWVRLLMDAAYAGHVFNHFILRIKRQRRLKIFVNPRSGPMIYKGNAKSLFKKRVEPILKAARCSLDIVYTQRQNHAAEIAAELPLDDFDAVLTVSGDGMVHEIFNGFATHKEPLKALSIPIVPMPAGSGNGSALNLLGLKEGLDISAAALSAIKGHPMKVDLCSIMQNGKRTLSFMSQSIGLMADVDLGTEHLRWMGSNRFLYGFIRGLITRKTCPVSISIKATETDKIKWDFMQFPVSLANDGTIDVVIQEHVTSRGDLLKAMGGAETGWGFWRDSSHYFKAHAYRVKPLSKKGYLSVDGEKFPFEEFLVEVHQGLGTVMSLHGHYPTKFDVPPPGK